MGSHHFVIFGGHWFSTSSEKKYLISHVTLLNHVIEGSCDFISGSSSLYFNTLPSLVAVGIAVVGICF